MTTALWGAVFSSLNELTPPVQPVRYPDFLAFMLIKLAPRTAQLQVQKFFGAV
jgi:hypothetical protein